MLGLIQRPEAHGEAAGLGRAQLILDARLDGASRAPLAVGLSGGGDSLALLILTLGWARRHGRRVVALTLDHRLHPDSADWTARALAAAARLGAEPIGLSWEGAKPVAGLPAAARDARHRRLAEAARGLGSKVLLLGHTADDVAEAALMRAMGSSVGAPREWAPSPVWPEGRGVMVLRPLLGVSRATLRDFLRQQGETWLEDPANDDLRFARARARRSAPSSPDHASPPPRCEAGLTPSTVAAAILCAAGHDRPPRRDQIAALMRRLAASDPVDATLAGARVLADEHAVRIARETGRRGLPALALPQGQPVVWDGRYEVTGQAPGLTIRALKGLAARLPRAERSALAAIPAFARPTLPALVDPAGGVTCPILAEDARARIVPLVPARLAAACGRLTREGDGDDPARGETGGGVLSWSRQ